MALFDLIDIGCTHLLNRVSMTPLTLLLSVHDGVPSNIPIPYILCSTIAQIRTQMTWKPTMCFLVLDTFLRVSVWTEKQIRPWEELFVVLHAR